MMESLRQLEWNLSGQIFPDSSVLEAHGGYCDVYIGKWIRQGAIICRVAVKRLRVHISSDRELAKVWNRYIRPVKFSLICEPVASGEGNSHLDKTCAQEYPAISWVYS